jgi:hypothetical protein
MIFNVNNDTQLNSQPVKTDPSQETKLYICRFNESPVNTLVLFGLSIKLFIYVPNKSYFTLSIYLLSWSKNGHLHNVKRLARIAVLKFVCFRALLVAYCAEYE